MGGLEIDLIIKIETSPITKGIDPIHRVTTRFKFLSRPSSSDL